MTTTTITDPNLVAPCPSCKAPAGEPCTSSSGMIVAPHKRRPTATSDLDAVVAEVAEAEAAYRAAVEKRTAAMRALNASDPKRYSTRRLAALTGVSFQRVSQLLSEKGA